MNLYLYLTIYDIFARVFVMVRCTAWASHIAGPMPFRLDAAQDRLPKQALSTPLPPTAAAWSAVRRRRGGLT